jgi:nucleotide-binding universal stress UspA family protein
MLAIKSVLVPTDFTETSNRALEYAVELASRFDAKVTVLHAYKIRFRFGRGPPGHGGHRLLPLLHNLLSIDA